MQEFSIAPATGRLLWLVPLVACVGIVSAIVAMYAALSGARSARFEVSPAGLQLRGDFYGRLIPVDQLRGAAATRVDLEATPGLRPTRRTMGTSMPGYRAGWFRLRNGEKALLYLTDWSRAVYMPTTAGYSVLISPSEPDLFLAAVRAVSRTP
jgi:hypothetical protein